MNTTPLNVEATEITEAPSLDAIDVYWQNRGPGQGSVTLCCFGSAWTAYFGAMNERSIQKFFADADTGYLVNKLGITPHLKQAKRDLLYLARIINAVKESLKQECTA